MLLNVLCNRVRQYDQLRKAHQDGKEAAEAGRVERISLPRATAEVDVESCSKASLAGKGHFAVYTIDQNRFVIPMAYLSNDIFRELKMV